MAAPHGIRQSTKIKYLQIYEMRKRRHSVPEIAEHFKCSTQFIHKALQYAQSWQLDLSDTEEIQLLIDSKEQRIERIYERLRFLEVGWESKKEKERVIDGSLLVETTTTRLFSPASEATFYREIRELEDDIVELKGLLLRVKKENEADTDWREEMERAGINPDDIYEKILQEIQDGMQPGDGTDNDPS